MYRLISFAGFLRFQEASQIRRHHVQFHGTHKDLLLPVSKSDQFNQGRHVIVAATGTLNCPVANLMEYCKRAGIAEHDDTCYVFRNVFFDRAKQLYSLRPMDTLMTYTCLREAFRAKLAMVGEHMTAFGLHSLRAGGCSSATNAGIDGRLVTGGGKQEVQRKGIRKIRSRVS